MGWPELAGCVAGARDRFAEQARAPRAAQETLLRAILARHAGSPFGQQHGFERLGGLHDFAQAVPPTDAESVAPHIAAMARGDRMLVDEPVQAFERTGGSSGGARLIPFTASGLQCVQQGLYAWLDDLCSARPAIMRGSSYWSISPATRQAEVTACGIPVGLASDAEYFGAAAESILELLAVPPAAAALAEVDTWRSVTLQALLADPNLALVSVWSPTFWLELCRHAVAKRERLAAAIAAGRWAVPVPAELSAFLPAPAANARRAELVASVLSADAVDWSALWPRLALISCWTHASSQAWVAALARQFRGVEIQGKGLLATEGMVSVPLTDGGDPVAALASTVLEFEDDRGRMLACDEVASGGEYGIVMTTSAGLYRYRLGDRVRVTGWWHGAPRLQLLGRATTDSDLCGEKLTEAFVLRCWPVLEGASARLVPCTAPGPHYRLLLDAEHCDAARAARLAAQLDAALAANPQYDYARRIGQLAPLAGVPVPRLAQRMQDEALRRGQRLGDAKPTVLGRLGEDAGMEASA
jgi:hypothetical protein